MIIIMNLSRCIANLPDPETTVVDEALSLLARLDALKRAVQDAHGYCWRIGAWHPLVSAAVDVQSVPWGENDLFVAVRMRNTDELQAALGAFHRELAELQHEMPARVHAGPTHRYKVGQLVMFTFGGQLGVGKITILCTDDDHVEKYTVEARFTGVPVDADHLPTTVCGLEWDRLTAIDDPIKELEAPLRAVLGTGSKDPDEIVGTVTHVPGGMVGNTWYVSVDWDESGINPYWCASTADWDRRPVAGDRVSANRNDQFVKLEVRRG